MADEALSRTRDRFANAPALLVLLTIVALAVLPRDAAALTGLIIAGVAPALIALFGWRTIGQPARHDLFLLSIAALPVAWLLIGSLAAQNPRISFVGMIGQHSGSLAWVAAYLTFAGAYLTARPKDLGSALRAVSILGVPLAAAAGLEALGVIPGSAYSASPSGILENPGSLGQVLVVTTLCAIGWAAAVRSERWIAAASAALGVIGLGIAASEGAWLGFAVGLVFGGIVWVLSRRKRLKPTLVAVATGVAIAAALSAVVLVGASHASGDSGRLAEITHDRAAIWASAIAQVEQAPVIGSGAEQFSAWVSWQSDPGVTLERVGTYDPHNVVLWWALAAGWAGAMLAAALAVFLAWRLALAMAHRPSPAVAAVLAALMALGATLLLTWTSPLALAIAALLLGSVLGATRERSDGSGVGVRSALVAVSVLGLLVAVAAIGGGALTEYRWARAARADTVTGAQYEQFARETDDPSYWSMAAESAVSGGGSSESTLVDADTELRRDAMWHVDAAFQRLVVEMMRDAATEAPDVGALEAAIADGRAADPASGLWDYAGAVYLANAGESEASAEYAVRALEYPLSQPVQRYLEGLARDGR